MGKGKTFNTRRWKSNSSFVQQGLEDRFDGHNRRNLRDIIIRKEDNDMVLRVQSIDSDHIIGEQEENDNAQKSEKYYVLDHSDTKAALTEFDLSSDDNHKSGLKVMARIPTCAIFHKLTTGRGVPHTFISEFYSIFASSLFNNVVRRLFPSMACFA